MNYDFRGGLFRILRVTVIVLVLIGAAVWLRGIVTSLKSEQAVINAEIIQIRTPITGQLQLKDIRPGMFFKKGDVLLTVENKRFGDRGSSAQYNLLQNQVENLQNELQGAKQNVPAEKLTLDTNRRLFQGGLIPRNQVVEAEARYENAVKLVSAKADQLAHSQSRLKEMAEQARLQRESVITMPVDGLIWSMAGKPGEQVDENHVIMEVINPAHIWVDAFFAERHANQLKPGLPAVIHSLDETATWDGSLDSVRAGVGRMAFATTVAVPPPEMVKRQIAVRVEPHWVRPFGPEAFYGVGRSVEVSFVKDAHPRTQADLLREKWEQAFSAIKGKIASASTAK
jgi:multidrug resistance efflux pump